MKSEDGDRPDESEPVVLTPVVTPAREGLRVQHMMFAVGVVALFAWLATVAGLLALTGSFLLMVALAVGAAVLIVRRRVMQRESLLWALAIAAERSLPLAPAALAFADQYGRFFRWRVQLLASLLNEGVSLPDALDEAGGLLSREDEVLVRTGHATGTLALALRQAAGLRRARQSAWGSTASRFAYLGVVFFVTQVITGFIAYFVAPKFEAIFMDFGVPLPEVTVATLRVSHALAGYGGVPLAVFGLIEVAVAALFLLGFVSARLGDVPLADSLFRRRHSALIMRALALRVGAGKPIDEGLKALTRDYPSGWVRRRLNRALADVRRGGDWVEALHHHALIRGADAAVLESARRVGNLDWALREMAESSERRIGYRLQFWLQLLFPLLVLSVGAVVFVIAVAYFSPLVRLIEVLAG